jgi:hypothetical protein
VLASTPDDIADAFAAMAKERPDGVIVLPSPMLFSAYGDIVGTAARDRLPAIGRKGIRRRRRPDVLRRQFARSGAADRNLRR